MSIEVKFGVEQCTVGLLWHAEFGRDRWRGLGIWKLAQTPRYCDRFSLARAVQNGWTDRDAVRDVDSFRPKEACVRWGRTLAPPGEYDWTIHGRRPCDLVSNYFDHIYYYNCSRPHYCTVPVFMSVFRSVVRDSDPKYIGDGDQLRSCSAH